MNVGRGETQHKQWILNAVYAFAVCIFFVFAYAGVQQIVYAAPAPYFALEATAGQGAGSDEFYVGRCFRVNMRVNTGSTNTNGADAEINYDNSILRIVDSDCSTSATDVYTDGLYDTYPAQGNSVSASSILLSAYNDPGNSTDVTNGLYGHFFAEVVSASSTYLLAFEYTQDVTTDTNLAETGGDGSDILLSVENLTLNLQADSTKPTITNQSPASGATGVAVNTNVTMTLADTHTGIDNSTSTAQMKKGAGAYVSHTLAFSSAQSTNQNRYYQYTGTITPDVPNMKTNGGYYEYNTVYTVSVAVDDLATSTPNTTTSEWSFTTEDDTDAPYISNMSPADSATGVATSTNISFRVKDYKDNGGTIPGLGVNTSSISIQVSSASVATTTYICSDATVTCDASNINNVVVTVNPGTNFAENEVVTTIVNATDQHGSPNTMSEQTFSFTTTDTGAPTLSSFTPTQNSKGNASSTDIGFHILDDGFGVAIETLQMWINDTLYISTDDEVTVSGDASDYTIAIDPPTDFTEDRAVVVEISVRDQSPAQNYISPNPTQYTFIVGLADTNTTTTVEITPSCPACAACSGGGGGVIYIEKECPVVDPVAPTIIQPPIVPSTEPLSTPVLEIVPSAGVNVEEYSEITIVQPEEIRTEISVDHITEVREPVTYTKKIRQYIDISDIVASEYEIIWEDSPVLLDIEQAPQVVALQTINNTPATLETPITVQDEFIELAGVSNAVAGSMITLLISPKDAEKNEPPTIMYAEVTEGGAWRVKANKKFASGTYRVAGMVSHADTQAIEQIDLGLFQIPEVVIAPTKTPAEQFRTEKVFDILTILIFLIIVGVSLSVLFMTKTMAGSTGFAIIFVFSILGIVLSVKYSNNTATLVSSDTQQRTAIVDKTQEAYTAYDTIVTQQTKQISSLRGDIVDVFTGNPIVGVSIGVEGNTVLTQQDGSFALSEILNTDSLKLAGKGLASPVYFKDVFDESEKIQIAIDVSLLNTIANIGPIYSQRKYAKVYPYIHLDIQKSFSQDTFVQAKNSLLLDTIKQYTIVDTGFDPRMELLPTYHSKYLDTTFNNVVKVHFVYVLYNDGGVKTLREPWYFVQENGGWVFIE